MSGRALACLAWCLFYGAPISTPADAQEANSGFNLRATLSGQLMASNVLTEAPRSGSPVSAGFRSVIYPTWKINQNWFATGALQLVTRPYFYADFSTPGYGAKGYVLQASLNYARVSPKGSLLVRAGELSSVFGSFLLRYDDADNALVDLPMEYGYYYTPVSTLGVAGLEADATRGRWDARAQFANSSPANPRSLFAHDQYGNWAGGAGYTIHQGFRVGVSGYRGPYLDREYQYFFPGEANPNTLPARALGADAVWAHGHSSVQGEAQHFVMPYTVIPTYREWASYAEVKQVLSPRWYIAARAGFTGAREPGRVRNLESATAFRPDRLQLIKFDYEIEHYDKGSPHNEDTFSVQLVTSLHASAGRD
jgi:hypothetical protein